MKKYLRPDEMLSALSISYPTLLRLVKAGKVPCIKIGSSLRFPASYLEGLGTQAGEVEA